MSYKSPIEMAITQFRIEQEKRLEESIFNAIHEVGITVNKDELIKALKYDREQYQRGYNEGYDEGFDKGYDADKWISVEERLPDENERVLCFSPSLVDSNLGAVSVQFGWCCKRRNMDITHWQPLPAPPTEKPYD